MTNNGTLTFNRTDAALSVANNISGTGTVIKAGTGATTLSGTNGYTGATSVNVGTLFVNSPGSTAAGWRVSVASGEYIWVAAARLMARLPPYQAQLLIRRIGSYHRNAYRGRHAASRRNYI